MSDTPPTKSPVNPYQSPESQSTQRRPVPRDLLVMCILFVVLSVLGCTFIFSYWRLAAAPAVGIIRCVGFTAIMAGIHFVGFRLWKRQEASSATKAGGSHEATNIWSQNVPRGLFWVVVFTVLLLLLYARI